MKRNGETSYIWETGGGKKAATDAVVVLLLQASRRFTHAMTGSLLKMSDSCPDSRSSCILREATTLPNVTMIAFYLTDWELQ